MTLWEGRLKNGNAYLAAVRSVVGFYCVKTGGEGQTCGDSFRYGELGGGTLRTVAGDFAAGAGDKG